MAGYKHRRVSLRTIKGIKTAERLKQNGWKVIQHSPDMLVFEKKSK